VQAGVGVVVQSLHLFPESLLSLSETLLIAFPLSSSESILIARLISLSNGLLTLRASALG
jgi:hypothetical protein